MENVEKFLDEILEDRIRFESDFFNNTNLQENLEKVIINILKLNRLADYAHEVGESDLLKSVKNVAYDFYVIRDKILIKINDAAAQV